MGWLEELDGVAGRVIQHDLGPARPGHDVAAKLQAGSAEPVHLGAQVLYDELDAVPAPRGRLPAVGQGPAARAQLPAEQQSKVVASDRGKCRHGVGLDGEAQVGGVEMDGGSDVVDDVADVARSHEDVHLRVAARVISPSSDCTVRSPSRAGPPADPKAATR